MSKTYTVNAEKFARYQKRKAAISAAKRRLDEEAESMGLPIGGDFDAPKKGVICDGNGTPLAKFSAFLYPGATIPPGMRVKIS